MAFIKKLTLPTVSTEVTYDGEILEDGSVQVRRCTANKDAAGNVIGTIYHRHVIHPGDDYSKEPQEVKDVCIVEHTDAVKLARARFTSNQNSKL